MHCQMRITIFCYLLVVSITTSNSLPKDTDPVSERRESPTMVKIRTVKETEEAKKMEAKMDSEAAGDLGLDVDSDVDSSSAHAPSFDESVLSCQEIFEMTDTNGDGRVTKAEYRHNNPNMTDEDVMYVFETYDQDDDGSIVIEDICSQTYDEEDEVNMDVDVDVVVDVDVDAGVDIEVGVAGHLPEPIRVDCRTLAIEICDEEAFLVVWSETEQDEDADVTVCRALETHIACVRRENEFCELESYLGDVAQTVSSFMRSGICQNFKSSEESLSRIPTSGVRQVRSARYGHRSRLSNSLRDTNVDPTTLLRSSHTCLSERMHPCNTNFISTLRAGNVDPCEALISYRRCARKSTRKCSDKTNAVLIKDGIKSITRAHRRAKLCRQ